MNVTEIIREHTWCSNAEREILGKVTELLPMSAFDENDQFIIEGLIRKSLLIKVYGKNDPSVVYVYPNA